MWPVYVNERTVERVAKDCRSSRNIHTVHFCHQDHAVSRAFVRTLAADVAFNYVILSVTVVATMNREFLKDLFALQDTTRRNSTLVIRAAQFVSGGRRDRHSGNGGRALCGTNAYNNRRYGAEALDRVRGHVALPGRVAELASVSEAEATCMIRAAAAGLRGLHDFMRLAGVVQEHVVCFAREDCRPQLDTLGEYGWSLIRRYLFLDEIATPHRGDGERLSAMGGK
ncbi:hypothetical protein V5799_003399 [Amblyomma americanum]|uniref:Uncharacterized protein n=1 Tax=Amblyomma americanum TaxID=6943 RepID=A0AAQ4D929_AMBAM